MSLTRGSMHHDSLDDGHRVVGAGAGHDDDLGDLDLVQMLVEQRSQQLADIGFFVVGGDADAAADLLVVNSIA